MALPSRLRVLSHLSYERSAAEATVFLATCKARTDGCAPFCTRDQLPAYVAALIANDSTPEPPPRTRGLGRPRKEPKRMVDPHLRYAQIDKRRVGVDAWWKSNVISCLVPQTTSSRFWQPTAAVRRSTPRT